MSRAIREHLRDFVAIIVLIVLAIVTTGVILVQQSANFPSWMPILGSDNFELKAEFTTAQAVTPGQGQQITIAGIKVGTVGGVKLENGTAVVTMDIDNKYAPLIHPDATLLLAPAHRPPGHDDRDRPGHDKQRGEGGRDDPAGPDAAQRPAGPDPGLPRRATRRSYLQLLLQAAGQGLRGQNGPKLAAALSASRPPPATWRRSAGRSPGGARTSGG